MSKNAILFLAVVGVVSAEVEATLGGGGVAGACPGSGDCCAPNGTPGCSDFDCCDFICFVDSFCCDVEWDQNCADLAIGLCDPGACGSVCPGSGDCGAPNGTPGCDDIECCEKVCAADPFCCDSKWDDQCAAEAAVLCACITCPYGDITSTKGLCIPDCTGGPNDVNFDDILCVIDGFANMALCPCGDICGEGGDTCIPNGSIDFGDIIYALEAFAGNPPCPDPCS